MSANETRKREYHGLTESLEYNPWCKMIQRCHNPKNENYKHYGERGITVAPEWRLSFTAFRNHIGPRPSTKHTIDRINNNGNYEPGNVRWATQSQQNVNRRNIKNTSGYHGVSWEKTNKRFVARISHHNQSIHIGTFIDPMEAAYMFDQYTLAINEEFAVTNFEYTVIQERQI